MPVDRHSELRFFYLSVFCPLPRRDSILGKDMDDDDHGDSTVLLVHEDLMGVNYYYNSKPSWVRK